MNSIEHFAHVIDYLQRYEATRHRCEVEYVLGLRKKNKLAAHDYLDKVRKARGNSVTDRLIGDCKIEWEKYCLEKEKHDI